MKLSFTETVLRDANQSLIATRLPIYQFETVLDMLNQTGYYSLECWGGATFDACIRYLNEDPWERLKIIRKHVTNTKLQMLLRGQSLLGYKHYPDDIVRKFVNKSIEAGIDIIRIFDALNDIKNIEVAVDETLKCNAHASCAISYTVSPVHNIEYYVKLAKSMEDMGAMSICVKDMSGILAPTDAFELITALKLNLSVPVILHSHCTTGLAYMTYLKAIEAGVDVLDTAISSFSGGTSQPATEVMAKVAKDMGRDTELNLDTIHSVNQHFRNVLDVYVKNGTLNHQVMSTDPRLIESQIPGGMLSNLISQLENQNSLDKYDDVLKEIPMIRKELGYPPLVTPISQMVGVQAVTNIVMGVRYKRVITEIVAYLRGEYGTPPGEVDAELLEKVLGKGMPERNWYAKSLEPLFHKVKKEHKNYSDYDILTMIMFPNVAEEFFKKRDKHFKYKISERNSNIHKHRKKIESDDIKAVISAIFAHEFQMDIKAVVIENIYEI